MKLASQLRAQYEFHGDVLDCIIDGKSMIDLADGWSGRPLCTHQDVERYLRGYGFDPENPIMNAELLGNMREAIEFIRVHFEESEVPRKLLELSDIRDLFLMANRSLPGQGTDKAGTTLRSWSCSVLKVMHTIAHVDKDLRAPYFPEIQKQILDRYYKVIHREASGALYLAEREGVPDHERVELVVFETKPKKSRDSILIKLLHKPENVAEELFDRVGIRFVTKTRLDALRVIRFLREQTIVVPANLKPSRSRNTLIDLESFRPGLTTLLQEAEEGKLKEEELVDRLDQLIANPPGRTDGNRFTSASYHAIQFTCRQLIVVRNPLYEELRSLRNLAKEGSLPEAAKSLVERIDLAKVQRETRFFYPYEVQVTDEKSFEENERGRSAHSEYKNAQVQSAKKRVMGSSLDDPRSQS